MVVVRALLFPKAHAARDPAVPLTLQLLQEQRPSVRKLIAAGVDVRMLCAMGASRPHDIRNLGFDALCMHTVDWVAPQLVEAFGARDVVATFISSPTDAVTIAGSPACTALGLSTGFLLTMCESSSAHSHAVLHQQHAASAASPPAPPCDGVTMQHILESGLGCDQLSACGLNAIELTMRLGATPLQLSHLGFRTRF